MFHAKRLQYNFMEKNKQSPLISINYKNRRQYRINENYYYANQNGVWELFERREKEYKKQMQEYYVRVLIGSEHRNKSLKVFREYIGDKYEN